MSPWRSRLAGADAMEYGLRSGDPWPPDHDRLARGEGEARRAPAVEPEQARPRSGAADVTDEERSD